MTTSFLQEDGKPINFQPMKIAYVTTYDAHDPRNWSGLGYHIASALEQAGCEIDYVGPLREQFSAWFRGKTLLYRKLKKQAFQRDREPAILDGYARQIEDRLRTSDAKIVFSPGTVAIANLKADRPIVFWSDGTYAAIQKAYRWELPAAKVSLARGHAMEQRAIDRAALAIYSSDWAAQSAIEDYRADPAKVKVVPFGANLRNPPSDDQVRAMIDSRPRDRCRLLFVGTGWERKGGDIAVEVARLLNERGIQTELMLIGRMPAELNLPAFAQPVGFIDKSSKQGEARFAELFGSSHFLLHPARAEASAVVLCEAGAFGLPVISTRVGGTPSIILDGINGLLFEPESPDAMANAIAKTLADPARYQALCLGAHKQSQERLNWRVAGQTVRELMESL
jgi:glycosyltransferase involved in cell wall biosynthesis